VPAVVEDVILPSLLAALSKSERDDIRSISVSGTVSGEDIAAARKKAEEQMKGYVPNDAPESEKYDLKGKV